MSPGPVIPDTTVPADTPPEIPPAPPTLPTARPRVSGKFLDVGGEKFYVKGITYGPFRPEPEGAAHAGSEYHTPDLVGRDFAQMAAGGYNAVRCYTVPPRWLLDVALRHGLGVFVGLPWEQHVAFLDGRARRADIERRVREGVRSCAGHPAVLCYAVGNEIPSPIVRWYGARRVQRFLRRLCDAVRAQDPGGLVTYVNYPSTEYLELPFLDFVSFNVYLEHKEKLDVYLAKLQVAAGDRPLVMAEVGLDSMRNGEERQARTLEWQVRSVFEAGCCGIFVFAWTDEWFRGGFEIDDWAFGLVRRDRTPKPALGAIARAYADAPFPTAADCPRVSVVVCTYNRAHVLRDCLAGLKDLAYPNYEVIVVDDGSTGAAARVAADAAAGFGYRLIRTENQGLSSARNTGLAAAGGEIVAYVDDDARPDPHWLTYLVGTFLRAGDGDLCAAAGGPNLPPAGEGFVAACVALSPGGPNHVLVSDRDAEHVPGCNVAFRADRLREVGGFDPRFRVAGDDVDVCWRVRERGWTIAFSPAALVWHRRRSSVRGYWKQQYEYGKAEAALERKWPARYDAAGRVAWAGRVYRAGAPPLFDPARRVYFGVWGGAPFQSVYRLYPGAGSIASQPEWYAGAAVLLLLGFGGLAWPPMLWCWAAAGLMAESAVVSAAWAGWRAVSHAPPPLGEFSAGETAANRARAGAERGAAPDAGSSPKAIRGGAAAGPVAGETAHVPAGTEPGAGGRSSARAPAARRGFRFVATVALLHLIQPAARLCGRMRSGLTPFRRRGVRGFAWPQPTTATLWSETWRGGEERVHDVEKALRASGGVVRRGGEYDAWDLELRGGLFAGARMVHTVEEHGGGKQLIRLRVWPRFYRSAAVVVAGFAAVALLQLARRHWGAALALAAPAALAALLAVRDAGAAVATAKRSFN